MKAIVKYLFEIGSLKRIRRTGWWIAGINAPESVAEHVFRSAVLGFILAAMEGADPCKTAAICLFHDMPETRIGDLHLINRRYLRDQDSEKQAFKDQLKGFPEDLHSRLIELFQTMTEERTNEARLAREADILECIIQAREYQVQGCSSVTDWIQSSYSRLRSRGAKRIAELCINSDPKAWWRNLNKRSPLP